MMQSCYATITDCFAFVLDPSTEFFASFASWKSIPNFPGADPSSATMMLSSAATKAWCVCAQGDDRHLRENPIMKTIFHTSASTCSFTYSNTQPGLCYTRLFCEHLGPPSMRHSLYCRPNLAMDALPAPEGGDRDRGGSLLAMF